MTAPGTGQLLFSFVRHWSRRSMTGDSAVADQGRLVLVTEAVAALEGRAESATVNAIAGEVGIDQSGASRLIGAAIKAGYVTMRAAPSDGRRREVSVTAPGHTVLGHAHARQEAVFQELTAGWSTERRDEFRRAMADLIARSRSRSLEG